MNKVELLNKQHALDGQLRFKQLAEGYIVAEVEAVGSGATIALQGAQVLSWVPAREKPVIWLSPKASFAPGKSVRGGAPICWPWFGAHADEADFPAHGYARTSPWELEFTEALRSGEVRLVLRLIESEQSDRMWPHVTPLECHITVGRSLIVELITHNEGAEAITLTEALHTYFLVGDVRKVAVLGLDQTDYLDKVKGFERFTQSGPIAIDAEVDRVYLDTNREVIIKDPSLGRNIHIRKRGSGSTIVWNPWVEKSAQMGDMGEDGHLHMLCVESGNAFDNAIVVEPGEEHRLVVEYSLSPSV
jgi:glucose-6-phosphate 1-epimerase